MVHDPTSYEMRTLELDPADVKRHTFYKGAGCHKCNKTGYRGRVGLYELLMINGSIREMVLEKRSAHEIRHHALKAVNLYGLQEDGIAKALLGWTTLEQVIRHAPRVPFFTKAALKFLRLQPSVRCASRGRAFCTPTGSRAQLSPPPVSRCC